MLNYKKGQVLAQIIGGNLNNNIIYVNTQQDNESESESESDSDSDECIDINKKFKSIKLLDGKMNPLLPINERSVCYIAGPSGSGKTTYAVQIIKNYLRIYPNKDFFVFSRTNVKSDPAFRGMKPMQIKIDESLIKTPINIETELTSGSILLFDDCNTIQNDKLKNVIDKLMADIMEIGRKLKITIVITNHLVIPNEKKMARTVLNELQLLTIFPQSGSSQQISYTLKNYFGFNKKQIERVLSLKSRWVTIKKTYPITVLYDKGCYIN